MMNLFYILVVEYFKKLFTSPLFSYKIVLFHEFYTFFGKIIPCRACGVHYRRFSNILELALRVLLFPAVQLRFVVFINFDIYAN